MDSHKYSFRRQLMLPERYILLCGNILGNYGPFILVFTDTSQGDVHHKIGINYR